MTDPTSYQQIATMTKALTQMRIANWLADDLFTWRWWFILLLLILPWIVFYYTADRKKLPRILLHGAYLFILISTLDFIGYENGLWTYPHKLLPYAPFVAFIDASPLPVIFMLEYQYFPRWRPFILVSTITSLVFSFVLEPILHAMDLYVLISWKYIYSFPIYIAVPVFIKLVIEKIFIAAGE